MKLSLLFIVTTIIINDSVFSDQINIESVDNSKPSYSLWFTGSLLELTPVNLDPGQVAIETVFSISNNYGLYDSVGNIKKNNAILAINPIVEFKLGLFPKSELKVVASYISKFQGKKDSSHFQDTLIYIGYEILKDKPYSITPDLSLFLQLTLPTGKVNGLDSQKLQIDASGQGAYQIGPALSYQKAFYLQGNYFILYGNFIYLFSTEASLKGFNAYGGGVGAKGKLRPGDKCFVILSGEYIFNQNWGAVCDIQFLYQRNSYGFKGDPGFINEGTRSFVGLPHSSQISITPSIEYNFSERAGIFGGAWLTLAGRNSQAFAGGFLSIVYEF